MESIDHRFLIDDVCSMHYFLSLYTTQEEEVGGIDDLCPVKIIETADPDVDWVTKEGVPSSMVRCYRTLWF
jgi:hypothetical protein